MSAVDDGGPAWTCVPPKYALDTWLWWRAKPASEPRPVWIEAATIDDFDGEPLEQVAWLPLLRCPEFWAELECHSAEGEPVYHGEFWPVPIVPPARLPGSAQRREA